jgi:Sulfotransferase family
VTTQADTVSGPSSTETVRVVCVGGAGLSGTTLLTRMLGRLPGVVAVGEVGYMWDWGLVENRACGCGRPFRDCPFWTKVGEEAFRGWDHVDPRSVLALRRKVTSGGGRFPQPVALALILRPEASRSYRDALRRYGELTARVYRAIHAVTGGAVIVDSMKRPSHVYMMSRYPGLDTAVVHVVRDSRGVAYSNMKWVKRQWSRGDRQGSFRVRRRPAKTAARWLWINLAFELLGHLNVRVVRVRYESLVRSPRKELTRIAGALRIPLPDKALDFIQDDRVDLGESHLVAGNRMRMRSGALPLQLDEEWRTHLRPIDAQTVSLISWPLLRRYAYTTGPGAGSVPQRDRAE